MKRRYNLRVQQIQRKAPSASVNSGCGVLSVIPTYIGSAECSNKSTQDIGSLCMRLRRSEVVTHVNIADDNPVRYASLSCSSQQCDITNCHNSATKVARRGKYAMLQTLSTG
eukprot:16184-Heterococcus_DN1.PRE.4